MKSGAVGGLRLRGGRVCLGLSILAAVALFGAAAPLVVPRDPTEQVLAESFRYPSASHPMGQDNLGRDILSRVIYGARVSLLVGLATVTISLALGLSIGMAAGYLGGWVDALVTRAIDVLLAFPGILLAIALTGILGPGLDHVVLALCAIGWTGYARLVRGEVMRLKESEFVEAAQALGLGHGRILFGHLLPMVAGPVMVQATFGTAGAIVAEASLSFLGLGAQPPTPSWGAMLNDGRAFVLVAPHMTIFPGLAIMLTVLAINLIGEGLRDVLDVRSAHDAWHKARGKRATR